MRRTSRRSLQNSFLAFIASPHRRVHPRSGFRPALSQLEYRTLLSTFTVVNTDDNGGVNPAPFAGTGTLRQAIVDSDATPGSNVVDFNIGGGGHQVITLASGLPVLTNAITIDGTTQPGFTNTSQEILRNKLPPGSLPGPGWSLDQPIVEINGNGLTMHALELGAPNCVIKGLVINNITGAGDSGEAIFIDSTASGFVIQGNYIGTDCSGSVAVPVSQGIECYATTGLIGGTGPGQGNVLSGAASGTQDSHTGYAVQVQTNDTVLIQGNFIGTNAAGTAAIPNSVGIAVGVNPGADIEVIGGTTPGTGNLISGNMWGAIGQFSSGGIFQGNLIGTDVTGTMAVPNQTGLSHVDIIGGTSPCDRNVISGNTGIGVVAANVVQGNYIGTDITGTVALANSEGVNGGYVAGLIGGPTPTARNIISGNPGADVSFLIGTLEGNFIGTDVNGENVPLGAVNTYGIIYASGATITGNVISTVSGTGLEYPDNCTIQGNLIGTNKEATAAIGNSFGIDLSSTSVNNTIGGTVPGQGNVISGNSRGIYFGGPTPAVSVNDIVEGNLIGTTGDGAAPLGNGEGIRVDTGLSGGFTIGGTAPGSGNVIAYNGLGVSVRSSSSAPDSYGVSVLGNSMFNNTGLGISLGSYVVNNQDATIPNAPGGPHNGANELQNYPVLTGAYAGTVTTVIGTLNTRPNSSFRIEFFANPVPDPSGYGQGQVYLGFTNVTTDASGNASFTATGLAATSPGEWISATATDSRGDTSEFSQDVQVVNVAGTVTSITTSANPSVFGQPISFAAIVGVRAPASGVPTGTITFMDGATAIETEILSAGSASFTTSSLTLASHSITAVYGGDTNDLGSTSGALSQVVGQDSTTTTVSSSASSSSFGQTLTFTATTTANAPGSGTPTGSVDFYDTTTSTDLTPGGVALSTGAATFSTTSLAAGNHTIKASYSGDTNFIASSASTSSITIGQSIIVLDLSAGGALSLSGNASIKLAGGVYVDSSSSSALSAGGNAQIKASVIDVHGGVQKSGNASFSPAPITGAATVADPLASLASPSTSGLTSYGSESLSGSSSATIKPGIYSQISVSGSAKLTLSSGIYIIEGGGFTVSGSASVSGSGVTIVNAGSMYPGSGGTYGSITFSSNGSYSLSPPTTGTYAGIVIFQTRDNSKALTLSGNTSGMTGTVYAPAAQLVESGNAQLNAAVVVDMLTVSGNGVANSVTLSAPTGTVAYTPAQIRAAYGINALSWDGKGQTIAIVGAYDDPSIYPALDAFDNQFGLTAAAATLYQQYGPATSFLTVLNQNGQATSLPTTDGNGPGTDNWEQEESLDVEWVHAIAPGAQIILVEANSDSLPDLMAGVATAAGRPGVSVVSMSWGFVEGQDVLAGDEATYDSEFTTPGVTFVASTGDSGGSAPQYPALSPNVVAVGGTSLTLNADNSYGSEAGWGYYSNSLGTFIGSGGGISQFENEPAYQQGVQSLGNRTIPDVAMVADPATGAWIADPYNLPATDPFEVVGGTSLSAPVWAGLLALANQGRVAASEPTLNSSSPTDTQQALYMLPQSDYHVISSGSNGYTANPGYNLVTGLGTPKANLLVPDLVAYHGPGTIYAGPTVGPLQDATFVDPGASGGGGSDALSAFGSITVTNQGPGWAQDSGPHAHLNHSARRSGTHPLVAGSFRRVDSSINTADASDLSSATAGGSGIMAPDANAVSDAALTDRSSSRVAVINSMPEQVGAVRITRVNRDPSKIAIWGGSRSPILQARIVDSLLEGSGVLLAPRKSLGIDWPVIR